MLFTMTLVYTVEPVLKTTCLENRPATKDRFGLTKGCILYVFERVWKDHLPYQTSFICDGLNTGFTASTMIISTCTMITVLIKSMY